MSLVLNNLSVWRERHNARQNHERLATTDTDETEQGSETQQSNNNETTTSASTTTSSRNNINNNVIVVETVTEDDDDEEDEENQTAAQATTTSNSNGSAEGGTTATRRSSTTASIRPRRTVTLADLEEERELARRRTTICALLAGFILFRLWIQAIGTGDYGLLVLCLVGTSWIARFIRYTREREEELDRLIQEYVENAENGGNSGDNNREDVRFLSFQAQLALAIMESQRQMMQGGYGHPDGHQGSSAGVSDEAKSCWDRFEFKESEGIEKVARGGYGSVPQESPEKGLGKEEEPHCSICLSEYEDGDNLVCLPCKHVFHEECIASWTSNHTRCPLCNFDLESVRPESSSSSTAEQGSDSAV